MAKALMIVESQPASAGDEASFHDWYDNTHIPELLQVAGFVSARRLRAVEGGTFLAIYEVDGDIDAVKAAMAEARAHGKMTAPVGVQLDPPPVVRWFEDR